MNLTQQSIHFLCFRCFMEADISESSLCFCFLIFLIRLYQTTICSNWWICSRRLCRCCSSQPSPHSHRPSIYFLIKFGCWKLEGFFLRLCCCLRFRRAPGTCQSDLQYFYQNLQMNYWFSLVWFGCFIVHYTLLNLHTYYPCVECRICRL